MKSAPAILIALVFSFALVLISAAPPKRANDPAIEAARLNNLGAAYMNQQLF